VIFDPFTRKVLIVFDCPTLRYQRLCHAVCGSGTSAVGWISNAHPASHGTYAGCAKAYPAYATWAWERARPRRLWRCAGVILGQGRSYEAGGALYGVYNDSGSAMQLLNAQGAAVVIDMA